MKVFLRSSFTVFVAVLWMEAAAVAHTPADFLEVFSVEAASPIEHAVELQSKLDGDRVRTMLAGPKFFSRAVGGMNRPVKNPLAFLSWYKIAKPQDQPVRELVVLDMVRGSASKTLKVQSAEFLLSPAQVLTTGVPDPVPGGLDHYKAYRVMEAPAVDLEVTLTKSSQPGKRRVGKPRFVCLAAEEWHHDEYFAASHPNDCFVVYELDAQPDNQEFNTLDQFGLNELQSSNSQWLCVRAALLRSKPKQTGSISK